MRTQEEILKNLNEIKEDLDLHLSVQFLIESSDAKTLFLMVKNSMIKQIEILEWVLNKK